MNHRRRTQQGAARRRPVTVPALDPASDADAVAATLAAAIEDHRARRLAEAAASYRSILEAEPDHFEALNLLGVVMNQTGDNEAAVGLIGKAVAVKPEFAEAHSNLGNAFKRLGRFDEAVASYRTAIALKPHFTRAHLRLGVALTAQGKLDEAVACYRRILAIKPGFVEAHYNLGNAFKKQGKLDQAIAAHRKAIALNPNFASAHGNLGIALSARGRLEEAVASYRKAIALKPNQAKSYSNLAVALSAQGKIEEAVAHFRKAIALNPDDARAHSNLLFQLHYIPGLTPEELFAEHRRWNAQHAAPLEGEIRPHTNARDPDRKVRVGFISGNFRHHPVGYMVTPAIEAMDPAAWELFMYSSGGRSDDLTERIRTAAKAWREIGAMKDDAVAQLVRDDGIDILVDLSGHAAPNRLLVIARKPAPVQVKWVEGEFNTTGMDAMDYFLSDAVETPPGAEKWFTEEVIRLPDGYVCYAPPAYAPNVAPLPAQRRGYTTFGCFNKLSKVNGEVVALWARLLGRLPGARLVLKTRALGDSGVRERYHAMFEEHGVETERVDLLAGSPRAELLAHYNEIDIALDPFPYSGMTTTCEALWMGVPVVTLPGERFSGRHSATHLHNVGLGDWVIETPEEYLAVAERWSLDVAALADLRSGLRARMAASPLCDGARFARNLEAAFRAMWVRWCEEPTPPSFAQRH